MTGGNGDAKFGELFFGLIFMDVHRSTGLSEDRVARSGIADLRCAKA
jgi:hypothetical protein